MTKNDHVNRQHSNSITKNYNEDNKKKKNK